LMVVPAGPQPPRPSEGRWMTEDPVSMLAMPQTQCQVFRSVLAKLENVPLTFTIGC
jgi:hypothetical protein